MANFDESKHPRDDGGKFTDGNGGEAKRVFDEAQRLGIDTKGIDNLDVIKAKVEEKKRSNHINSIVKYGAYKKAGFTKKHIGVLYSKAKNGQLKIEKWVMSKLYDMTDYFGYDDNRTFEKDAQSVANILNLVFEGNDKEAQEQIDFMSNSWYQSMSRKYQEKIDRNSFL